jgi:hypothetical protein
MNWKQTRLFMRRWLWYTIHDAFAQTFGWLSLGGVSFGGFIAAKFGIRAASDPFKSNLIGAASGFVIGLGVYAIVGIFAIDDPATGRSGLPSNKENARSVVSA